MDVDLIKIGYWRSVREPNLPDVRDFVGSNWDAPFVEVICLYLDNGSINTRWRGWSKCRICGEPNGSNCLDDNTYMWPEGLSHYVRDHGVQLPDHFVQHLWRANSIWRVRPDCRKACQEHP